MLMIPELASFRLLLKLELFNIVKAKMLITEWVEKNCLIKKFESRWERISTGERNMCHNIVTLDTATAM